jgi:hypothetical protein
MMQPSTNIRTGFGIGSHPIKKLSDEIPELIEMHNIDYFITI